MLRGEDDGSEQPSSSDLGQSLYLRKLVMLREEIERKINILRGEIPVIVIKTVQQEINPAVIEGSLRKVVKEEFQKFLTRGTRNDVPEERSLHLKFLDEVAGPVQTSKEFKGLRGGPLKVALFDATGNPVTSGPESSAEVEIALIDASGNESNTTNGNFESNIIRSGEKGKPHFARNVYVKLDKGEGVLINQKLGQDSKWTRNWTCRLGARFVKNSRGLKVQNAWTEPFSVIDKRGKLYEKHEPPYLKSEVWRLKEICRDGEPCRRLEGKKIKTVQDLRFWLSVNPKRLQKKLGAGENRWNTIVDHARTCIIDDKKLYCHKSSTEPLMAVIYDSVGELKGVIINDSHFVPFDDLSADEKERARELLRSVLKPDAFVGRYQTFFDDEASLLQQYPHKSSASNASTNCTTQQCLNPIDPGCSFQLISRPVPDHENIYGDIPTDLGTLSLDDQPIVHENAGTSDDWRRFVCCPSNTYDLAMVEELFLGWSPSPNPENIGDILTASVDVEPNVYQNADECLNDDGRSSQDGVHQMSKHASKRWTKLYHVLLVSINVTHPKRKKQRVG